jgi:hypothetical protein
MGVSSRAERPGRRGREITRTSAARQSLHEFRPGPVVRFAPSKEIGFFRAEGMSAAHILRQTEEICGSHVLLVHPPLRLLDLRAGEPRLLKSLQMRGERDRVGSGLSQVLTDFTHSRAVWATETHLLPAGCFALSCVLQFPAYRGFLRAGVQRAVCGRIDVRLKDRAASWVAWLVRPGLPEALSRGVEPPKP